MLEVRELLRVVQLTHDFKQTCQMIILFDLDDSPTGPLYSHYHLLAVLDLDNSIRIPSRLAATTSSDLPGHHLGYDSFSGLSEAVQAGETCIEGAQQVLTQVIHVCHPLAREAVCWVAHRKRGYWSQLNRVRAWLKLL